MQTQHEQPSQWFGIGVITIIFLIFLISLIASRNPLIAKGFEEPEFSEVLSSSRVDNTTMFLNDTAVELPHALCDMENLKRALQKAHGHRITVTRNNMGTVIVEFSNQPSWNCRP